MAVASVACGNRGSSRLYLGEHKAGLLAKPQVLARSLPRDWRRLRRCSLVGFFRRALRIGGMPRGSTLRQLAFELAQPFQLGLKLLNHESDHLHRLMMRVADLLQNRAQDRKSTRLNSSH